jgi:heme/copper-type cytochrome/quinol oxidase subunit 1
VNADVWLIGVTFVEISALAVGIELAVTILTMRAGGMALQRMPLFGWYMLVTAFMIILAFPPLILASILLELERAFDWPFFSRNAAATRCCGSICSGCSAIRRSTSSSSRRPDSYRR